MLKVCRPLAIAGALGMSAGISWAEAPDSAFAQVRPLLLDEAATEAVAEATPAPPRRPLMALLDQAGLAKSLDDLKINIFGHIEGSYTHNFADPDDDLNAGRVFDFEHNKARLNQIDLTVERIVDVTKWDIGGRVEMIYGADAGLIHSNGLFDWYDSPRDPINQWDLNQAYLDVGIPVGNGLRVRAGKIVTLLGWETINPTTVPFYSRSYLFGFAIPFTHTGVMGTYALNDNWLVEGGIFRGWEQSLEDNNDAASYHGKVAYTTVDKRTTAMLNVVTGPERADNSRDYRTVVDLILSHAATDRLTLAINGDYGYETGAAEDDEDAQWYGVAGYGGYKINDYITFNTRLEWFRDNDATRIGLDASFYEATIGVTLTPLPNDAIGSNLKIRPEIRYDYCDEDFFDGGDDQDQVTVAVDAYFTF